MTKKNVLLVGVGVVLGYFASRMNWGRKTANAVGNVATGVTGVATGIVSDVKDVAVDTVKMAECEKKLIEQTRTMRFSEGGLEAYRKSFMAECMATK